MNSREVALSALFVAFTAASSWVSIPLGPVPFTLQVFAVLLTGLLLGSRLGFIAMCAYVFAGSVGFPVFANFTGGFAHLYGPTGGYLLAFPIAALVTGLFAERSEKISIWVFGALVALGVIYLLGWLRLALYFGGSFKKALFIGVVPFMPLDVAKAILAVGIARAVKKTLPRL